MDTKKMLRALMFTPGVNGHWGIPVLLEGKPGTAKSSIIEQLGKDSNLHTEVVIASVRSPEDFIGLPVPDNGKVSYMPTSWAYRINEKGSGIAFLDELSCAAPAVQAALLRVVLDRAVGDLQLPKRVRIIAAQNSVEEAAGGHDLSLPLANRFLHWNWEAPTVDAWSNYILGDVDGHSESSFDPAAEERRVMETWPLEFAKAKGLITSFLRKMPDLLHKQPNQGSPDSSKAWPSRRTWEMAIRVLAGGRVHGLSDAETETLVSGCVGNAAAAQLAQFATDNDFPNPELILDGKVTWKIDSRLDRTIACLNSCAALVAPEQAVSRKPRVATLWKILTEIAKTKPDITVSSMQVLMKANLHETKECKAYMVVMKPITDLGASFIK